MIVWCLYRLNNTVFGSDASISGSSIFCPHPNLRSRCPSRLPSLAFDNPAAWDRTLSAGMSRHVPRESFDGVDLICSQLTHCLAACGWNIRVSM